GRTLRRLVRAGGGRTGADGFLDVASAPAPGPIARRGFRVRPRPRPIRVRVRGVLVGLAGVGRRARAPGQPALELAPADRRVVPAHGVLSRAVRTLSRTWPRPASDPPPGEAAR